MNFELARFNMIEQQIRPWNMFDEKVLDYSKQSSAKSLSINHCAI